MTPSSNRTDTEEGGDMVERVARAICLINHEDPEATWERKSEWGAALKARWERRVPDARAAILAMPSDDDMLRHAWQTMNAAVQVIARDYSGERSLMIVHDAMADALVRIQDRIRVSPALVPTGGGDGS